MLWFVAAGVIVAARIDDFVAGLGVGTFLGLCLSPLLRAWLASREVKEASRERQLAEDLLDRMSWDVRPREPASRD